MITDNPDTNSRPSESPSSRPMTLRQQLIRNFEDNFLDGDKIQSGQMIATTEVAEFIRDFAMPMFELNSQEIAREARLGELNQISVNNELTRIGRVELDKRIKELEDAANS